MNTEYLEQAKKFLADTTTTLEVVKAVPQKAPLWHNSTQDRDIKHGINYSVTLKNKNHSYTFDFWGSIADLEKLELAQEAQARGIYSSHYYSIKDWCDKQATATVPNIIKGKKGIGNTIGYMWLKNVVDTVNILITPTAYDILACLDVLYEDNFKDFCTSYGYEVDSINALKTFEAVKEQDRNLRKLFDRSELETLAEIQ